MMVRSKRGHVVLPLLLLIGHELHEARILPDVVQVGISVKERITWKAVFGGHSQVFHGWLRFVHQSVSRSDDVRGVMEVFIAFSDFDGAPNSLFRSPLITGGGCEQGLHAGEQSARVLGIFLQELVHPDRSLILPSQLIEGEGGLEGPE